MLNRVSIRTLVVLLIILAGALLTPGGLPSRTQAAKDLDLSSQQACDPEEDMDKDLDRIRPHCLKQYLWAELDDCIRGHDP
ncbi:MAG: hypothetical protein ACKVX9_17560, partial [Blastocatellia bacterium]